MSSNQNLQLWVVHFMSSYYDDGIVPVDERFFVVAENYDQAIEKCKSELKKLKKKYVKNEIKAIPLPMETLVVARDSSGDGRLGWFSNKELSPVSLSLKKDKEEYRIAICLVPKK